MFMPVTRNLALSGALLALAALGGPATTGQASDHGDTPDLIASARHDARLTDLYAFTRGDRLVLALCSNPAIAPETTAYRFPSDVRFSIFIDSRSAVELDDAGDLATFGGTIEKPKRIHGNIRFVIEFDEAGEARLRTKGLSKGADESVSFFAGLRDDPFIRGPRIGRNIAAIVLELPLALVTGSGDPTILVWATSRAKGESGAFQDLTGRSLRSQFPENDRMNTTRPRKHAKVLGVRPDVLIYDTSRPASFPNGRELADDVVDLVGDPRVLGNDAPFPSENDVPFLGVFPYLAPPHLP
jgi:hypothetical protein